MPNKTILVIEAGVYAPDEEAINVPGKKGSTIGTSYDWQFSTVPQESVNNRSFSVPRGKVLGGTSAMNLMSYDRASAEEYDAWEDLGNAGWDWNTMIAAMKKSETFHNKGYYEPASTGVGTSGPINAVINRIEPEHQWTWIPTLQNLAGLPENTDSLAGNPLGVMKQPSNVNPAIYNRSYSANAYLPLARPNLEVMTETVVTKVNLKNSGHAKKATGVTLSDGSVIRAKNEVIISAGSIQSPGLLELSGIGQPSVLSAAGINCKIALPGVGENYQDHMRIQAAYQLQPNFPGFDKLKYDAAFAAQEIAAWRAGNVSLYDYTASGFTFLTWNQTTGDDASLMALAQAAIGNSNHSVDQQKLAFLSSANVPQLEVIFSDGYTGSKGYPALGTALYGENFFSLIAAIMHPLSRGNVHINPSDPTGKPLINPNFMSNAYDVEALKTAIRFVRQIANTSPMSDVWVSEYEPGTDTQTEKEWEMYVKASAQSIYHPVGTCAMLPLADGGVVDNELIVYGTKNLRVVDASIMPILISAHIQTAVYGIAERAAEIIMS